MSAAPRPIRTVRAMLPFRIRVSACHSLPDERVLPVRHMVEDRLVRDLRAQARKSGHRILERSIRFREDFGGDLSNAWMSPVLYAEAEAELRRDGTPHSMEPVNRVRDWIHEAVYETSRADRWGTLTEAYLHPSTFEALVEDMDLTPKHSAHHGGPIKFPGVNVSADLACVTDPDELVTYVGRARTQIVQRGTTLAAIASSHGLTVPQLLSANPALSPNRVSPGQLLALPADGVSKAEKKRLALLIPHDLAADPELAATYRAFRESGLSADDARAMAAATNAPAGA